MDEPTKADRSRRAAYMRQYRQTHLELERGRDRKRYAERKSAKLSGGKRGCYGAPAFSRSDIPAWLRVDAAGAVWTSHNLGGHATDEERRAERLNKTTGYLDVLVAGRPVRAHRLVYAWFHGEAPEGVLVRHLNDVKTDNRPENLALGDNGENLREAVENGRLTHEHSRGERNNKATLTADAVRQIRAMALTGMSVKAICRELGVTYPAAWNVVRGNTWQHIA